MPLASLYNLSHFNDYFLTFLIKEEASLDDLVSFYNAIGWTIRAGGGLLAFLSLLLVVGNEEVALCACLK